jgi:hypothetical protein
MSWQRYDLVFRLMAPLHIGYRKTGNLQQTRRYVPGKNIWAALTARLTREYDDGASGQAYQKIGRQVQEKFRFTYLYPATKDEAGAGCTHHYPWQDDFDYLFLNSYTSAALDPGSKTAADALLHDTEFIAPRTRDGRPVYLTGSVYTQTDLPAPLHQWQNVLNKLQIGGEQGYGWGRLRLANEPKGEPISGDPTGALTADGRILAHLRAESVANPAGVTGSIEPLVGWERDNDEKNKRRWQVSAATICYQPGSRVGGHAAFPIGKNGILDMDVGGI